MNTSLDQPIDVVVGEVELVVKEQVSLQLPKSLLVPGLVAPNCDLHQVNYLLFGEINMLVLLNLDLLLLKMPSDITIIFLCH